MRQNTLQRVFSLSTSSAHTRQQVTLGIQKRLRKLVPLFSMLAVLLVWQLITSAKLYPEFIIPSPAAVYEAFISALLDGRWWHHVSTTLSAVLSGLAVGVAAGLAIGYLIAKNRLLEEITSPLIVTLQSTPVVAYAPLLVIWFGDGVTSKIITCALIVFFPMLMNTVVGIQSVPTTQRELMRSIAANPLQTLIHLEVPAALPLLLGGLKVSATLSVIGAVVGEFVSAKAGLGFLINIAKNQYDTALVFVAVLSLALIARTLYSTISFIENRVLTWKNRSTRA